MILSIYIILLFFLLSLANSKVTKTVENENELKSALSSSENELTIKINTKIILNSDIVIDKKFEKLSFIGTSVDTSSIQFSNLTHQIYFKENVQEIEIFYISIFGNIRFENNVDISIDEVNLYGSIDSNFESKSNLIEISNFNYYPSSIYRDNCINLEGNVLLEDSFIYGNSFCQNRLLNYNGLDKYTITIVNTKFSGEYECSCVNINNGLNVSIKDSLFEKAYASSSTDGGAALRIDYSYVTIKNCEFRENYSESNGGSFYLNNNYKFDADKLTVFNTTAIMRNI
ncbi:hypothetical protein BCR32DRAFT_242928 [Anaeromyces robustus]|uniref:Right handed beta helix domain-containing protein n=1 Tax=Anaeromyces robustus TaxID=1754192 RepID=A0A1Y1XED0_9FUNG|nr:hypothetical protein BCR32DRAFT_242928 [Anaeromyces robustus]|eukprot:ORX84042.1 hypothetical protein BCR32DRAFT_242928 [Anaeromyces robustus]